MSVAAIDEAGYDAVADTKHFVRHYAEMVAAMFAGMLGAMLLRPDEYTAAHGHANGEPERVVA